MTEFREFFTLILIWFLKDKDGFIVIKQSAGGFQSLCGPSTSPFGDTWYPSAKCKFWLNVRQFIICRSN